MPTRLVLIGYTDAGKLFYNVDATPIDKNAMFVDRLDNETPVDLVSFISTNPDINEITTTPFHKFVWGTGSTSEAERWNRTFVTRTQPIDESLLKNIEIKKKPKKRISASNKNNQIMAFKSLSLSNNFDKMPGSSLGKRNHSRRSMIGINTKIIGPVRAGYDGDNDGFVDDGLPTMRPFIPGIDIAGKPVIERPRQGGMRIRTSTSPVNRFSPVSADEIRRKIIAQDEFIRKRFNGGNPITTIGDVKRILMAEIPNFASGSSRFDFLDGADDEPLQNYAYENIVGFLLALHANPNMKNFNYEMTRFNVGEDRGTGGSTRYQSGYQWQFINGKFVPTKERIPKITIKYRHPMDPEYKSTVLTNSFNEGRFDVSSNIIGSSMLNSLSEDVGGPIPNNELLAIYSIASYQQMSNIVEDYINRTKIALSAGMDDLLPGIESDAARVIKKAIQDGIVDPRIFSNGATLRKIITIRDAIDENSKKQVSELSDIAQRALKFHEEMWDVQARTIAIHEATHAAHMAQMHSDMMSFLQQNGVDPAQAIPMVHQMIIDKMDEKQLRQLLQESSDTNTVSFSDSFGRVMSHLMTKATRANNSNAGKSLSEFLNQKVYQPNGKPYVLNRELADFMNSLEVLMGKKVFGLTGPYSEGDEMTLFQVHVLSNKSLLSMQRKDVRRQFAGMPLVNDKSGSQMQNSLTLIRKEGYPSLVTPSGAKTKPLSKATGALIVDAAQSAMGIVARMLEAKTDLTSVREVTAFRHAPSDSVGPLFNRPDLKMDAVEKMDLGEVKDIAKMTVDSAIPAITQNQQPSLVGTLLESMGMDFWHFDSLSDDNASQIINLARESAEPGYRNYMSTALNRRIFSFLNANPDSSELIAELAVYDAFGIPIRVTDELGNGETKRALTSDEIKAFDKLLSWIFPKGKLSNIGSDNK